MRQVYTFSFLRRWYGSPTLAGCVREYTKVIKVIIDWRFSFMVENGFRLKTGKLGFYYLLMTDDAVRHIRLIQIGDLFLSQFHG